jgi:hypothetical protein
MVWLYLFHNGIDYSCRYIFQKWTKKKLTYIPISAGFLILQKKTLVYMFNLYASHLLCLMTVFSCSDLSYHGRLPWLILGVRPDQFFYSHLSIHFTRCSYLIPCISITYYTEFCDFDPLHDQVVVACEVFLALPTYFVATAHPIMSMYL